MKTFVFLGSSDDTFGEYGITGEEVDNCGANKPIIARLSDGKDQILIMGHYNLHPTSGVWTIGVALADEDIRAPEWPVRINTAWNGYSPTLEVDAPDSATLDWWYESEKCWDSWRN